MESQRRHGIGQILWFDVDDLNMKVSVNGAPKWMFMAENRIGTDDLGFLPFQETLIALYYVFM